MSKTVFEADADGLPPPRRYFAVAVLLLTLVLVVLDGSIVNVALPTITASLRASPSDAVWVISSYQLAILIALLPCGVIGEMLGARRVFLTGVTLFTLASAACAFSASLPMLIAARATQGLGAGAIMALSIMNLRYSVPQRLLGTIIGINAMTIAIASAAGPGIAGAILAVAPWPFLFAVNIPLGIIVLMSGAALPPTKGVARRLDVKAVAANTLMFAFFFLGAGRIAHSPVAGALLVAASIVCLLALLRIERESATPLLPTDLFAAAAFRFAVMASVCCFTGTMLSFIAAPFYLQHNLGMTATEAGLYMMSWPAAVALIAPISGRLADRVKTAWLCATGGALLAIGLTAIGLLPPDPHGTSFVIGAVVAGLGFGMFQTPNNRILLLSAPKARSGAAGAMQGTARLTGQTLGGIAMSLIFAVAPLASAPEVALLLAAAFAGFAAVISLGRVRHEQASWRPTVGNPS